MWGRQKQSQFASVRSVSVRAPSRGAAPQGRGPGGSHRPCPQPRSSPRERLTASLPAGRGAQNKANLDPDGRSLRIVEERGYERKLCVIGRGEQSQFSRPGEWWAQPTLRICRCAGVVCRVPILPHYSSIPLFHRSHPRRARQSQFRRSGLSAGAAGRMLGPT
jgi:hypothetical protein